MNKRHLLIAGGLTTLGALVGFGVKALADGIPSPNPLYYSGTLTEGGKLVDGTRAVTINLWPDATTMGMPLCQTVASTTSVVSGRFRIALASSCKTAINQNNNAYVEVIDGAASLGRTPIGAVPYAVEADHAVSATNVTGPQAQQIVPSGAVMYFNLAACPNGWTAFAAGQGRYVVGLDTGGTLAATIGSALSDQENRAVGQHGHTVNDPGHNHGGVTGGVANWAGRTDPDSDYSGGGGASCSGWSYTNETSCGGLFSAHYHSIASSTTNIIIENAGTVAGTNAPYVQLIGCQKN